MDFSLWIIFGICSSLAPKFRANLLLLSLIFWIIPVTFDAGGEDITESFLEWNWLLIGDLWDSTKFIILSDIFKAALGSLGVEELLIEDGLK